jgi:hypothetical protein
MRIQALPMINSPTEPIAASLDESEGFAIQPTPPNMYPIVPTRHPIDGIGPTVQQVPSAGP